MLAVLTFLFDKLSPGVVAPAPLLVPNSPDESHVVAVRDGYKLSPIENRKAPKPGRRHQFADVPSFAAFVVKHLGAPADVEILAGEASIVATSGATWWRDEVRCTIAKHPTFLAWEQLLGRQTTQDVLYKRLTPLVGSIGPSFLTALGQIDLSTATEANYSMNEHGTYDVVAKRQTTSGTAKLPSRIIVKTPIYLDAPVSTFTLAVMLEPLEPGKDPVFTLVPIDMEEAKLAAYREQVVMLRGCLGAEYLVGMGSLAFEA